MHTNPFESNVSCFDSYEPEQPQANASRAAPRHTQCSASGRTISKVKPPAALRNFWDHFHGQASSEIAWPPMAPPDGLPMDLHGDDARYLDNGAKIIAISMNFMLDAVQDRFPLVVIRLATWPIE